jgi:hypothetical protein
MIDFPAREVGTGDLPLVALSIRSHDESALACANQYSYAAHLLLFLLLSDLANVLLSEKPAQYTSHIHATANPTVLSIELLQNRQAAKKIMPRVPS